ncbi:MAG: GtrA family protein [Curvibacter sp.]|nr:GtrA family protein [Curvibacter sp.]
MLLRYFFVSAVAFLIDISILSIGVRYVGISWVGSSIFGFLVGVLVSYLLSISFVFSKRKYARIPWFEFFWFFVIGLIGLLITEISIYFGVDVFGLNLEFSKFMAAVNAFACNYIIRKYCLFN